MLVFILDCGFVEKASTKIPRLKTSPDWSGYAVKRLLLCLGNSIWTESRT